jgi:hypothetical protein
VGNEQKGSHSATYHLEITQAMLEIWLASWGEDIRKAHPQPNTAQDILRDAAIYLERLQSQPRRVLRGYLQLLETKGKPVH